MANSQQFMDDLGPLAAMWAGRNQGMQENTNLVNQQLGLESIATSQQNRDIAKQKLPFELGQLEHQQKMNPLLLEEKQTAVTSGKRKLDKDQFDNFFGQFKDILPTLQGTPADAAILGELAKKNGMDPADPRIGRMIATATSGNQAAINDMMKRIALMSEKSIQERAKQGDMDKAHGERTTAEIAGRERVAQINANSGIQRAQITAAARAKAKGDMHQILQLTKGDPVKTKAALIQLGNEAMKAGDMDKAQAYFDQANDPALSALADNQQAQRTQPIITPEGNIGTTGGTKPVPRAGPVANPAATAAPQPGGASGATSMPPGYDGQPAQNPQPVRRPPPQPGEVRGGYTFKGGDPADKNNWVKN